MNHFSLQINIMAIKAHRTTSLNSDFVDNKMKVQIIFNYISFELKTKTGNPYIPKLTRSAAPSIVLQFVLKLLLFTSKLMDKINPFFFLSILNIDKDHGCSGAADGGGGAIL